MQKDRMAACIRRTGRSWLLLLVATVTSVQQSVSLSLSLALALSGLAAVACVFPCWQLYRNAQVGQTKTILGKYNRHHLEHTWRSKEVRAATRQFPAVQQHDVGLTCRVISILCSNLATHVNSSFVPRLFIYHMAYATSLLSAIGFSSKNGVLVSTQ